MFFTGNRGTLTEVNRSGDRTPENWKRRLFLSAAIFLGLLVVYYLSYAWWGRERTVAGTYVRSGPEITAETKDSWKYRAEMALDHFYLPLRQVDEWRFRQDLVETVNGAWRLEDGKSLEIWLRASGKGEIRSDDFPAANGEGTWRAVRQYGGARMEWLIFFGGRDLKLILEQYQDGGMAASYDETPLSSRTYLSQDGKVAFFRWEGVGKAP